MCKIFVLCISLCIISAQGAVTYQKSSTKFTISSAQAHQTPTPSTKPSEIQTLRPNSSEASPIPANSTTKIPPKEGEQSEEDYYYDDAEFEEEVEDPTSGLICTLFGDVGCNATCATISYFYDTAENTGTCDEHSNCDCKPQVKLKNLTLRGEFEKTENTLQNLINEFFQIPKQQNSQLKTVSNPVSAIADKYHDTDHKTLQQTLQPSKNQISADTKNNAENENGPKYIKNKIHRKANPAMKKHLNMKSAAVFDKNMKSN